MMTIKLFNIHLMEAQVHLYVGGIVLWCRQNKLDYPNLPNNLLTIKYSEVFELIRFASFYQLM